MYIYIAAILYILVTFAPLVMDVIVPLNESRTMDFPVISEYFIDKDKYFYPIFIHMSFTILLSITVIVAADTQLMVFSCHVSGLFAIVG